MANNMGPEKLSLENICNGAAVPTLTLIEADGGAWQLDAMRTVADYLKGRTTIPVIV